MIINTNITAQVSAHNLQSNQALLSKSLSRLSSGNKIVNPADDAAGMAVGSRLDAQIRRLGAAKDNVGNAVSFTQTQDGYLKKIAKALERMSELAILAQDETKSDADRTLYQREFGQLSAFIDTSSTKDFSEASCLPSGSSSMVEPQPSKLMTRVRFPSPAPCRQRLGCPPVAKPVSTIS